MKLQHLANIRPRSILPEFSSFRTIMSYSIGLLFDRPSLHIILIVCILKRVYQSKKIKHYWLIFYWPLTLIIFHILCVQRKNAWITICLLFALPHIFYLKIKDLMRFFFLSLKKKFSGFHPTTLCRHDIESVDNQLYRQTWA